MKRSAEEAIEELKRYVDITDAPDKQYIVPVRAIRLAVEALESQGALEPISAQYVGAQQTVLMFDMPTKQ